MLHIIVRYGILHIIVRVIDKENLFVLQISIVLYFYSELNTKTYLSLCLSYHTTSFHYKKRLKLSIKLQIQQSQRLGFCISWYEITENIIIKEWSVNSQGHHWCLFTSGLLKSFNENHLFRILFCVCKIFWT